MIDYVRKSAEKISLEETGLSLKQFHDMKPHEIARTLKVPLDYAKRLRKILLTKHAQ